MKLDHVTSAAVDQLFRGPLAAFITARNELHTRVKGEDPAGAAWIKGLGKPSVSAWAVNQIYWRAPELYRELVESGAALHAVTGGDAEGMRAAMATRRHALDRAVAFAEGALRDAGHGTSMGTMRRVSMTLEALAAHGGSDAEIGAGRLSADVDPPALGQLALLASLAAVPPPRVAPIDTSVDQPRPVRAPPVLTVVREDPALAREREALARAREAVAEAEGDLQVLAHEARRAGEAREATAERLSGLDARVEEARAALAQLEDKLAVAQREARDARSGERRAADAEARAVKRVERAKAKLDELE